jgi:glycine/D-amino acid oxidase-like deaminating enzyme
VRSQVEDVIVGAGPAGLAVAAVLRRGGRDPIVLERGDRVGGSWRNRYDCLRLNTARWWSSLPGLAIPRRLGTWVAASDYADYLELYAQHHELHVRFGVEVTGISRRGGAWSVATSDGEIEATNVVIATGYDREPFIPPWPGLDRFSGSLIHASDYRNPDRFAGRHVLVVGAGNSAADIAVDLVRGGAAQVWISIRTPPQVVPRTVGGVPMQTVAVATRALPPWVGDAIVRAAQKLVHGDLTRHGVPPPRETVSAQFRRADVVPVIDVEFVRRVKAGELEAVAAVKEFERDRVALADGSDISPEAVVAATGYRRDLEGLVGDLGVLDVRGLPVTRAPDSGLRGLYFAGFTNPLSGNLRELGIHARQIADQIRNSGSATPLRAWQPVDLGGTQRHAASSRRQP